jgi:hypothetical protein
MKNSKLPYGSISIISSSVAFVLLAFLIIWFRYEFVGTRIGSEIIQVVSVISVVSAGFGIGFGVAGLEKPGRGLAVAGLLSGIIYVIVVLFLMWLITHQPTQ